MSPENFCYWLQGWFEIGRHNDHNYSFNNQQIQEIKNHLKLVFEKVTPELKIDDVLLKSFTKTKPILDKDEVLCSGTTGQLNPNTSLIC